MSTHHHRSTLKQQNKSFKSRHATKSSIKEKAKGRVPVFISGTPATVKRSDPRVPPAPVTNSAQNKQNRRNHAKQVQKAKRQSLVEATRMFNGVDGAPRIVTVIPLCSDVTAKELVMSIVGSLGPDVETKSCPELGIWRTRAERFRTNLQFVLLPYGAFYETLDAGKVSDYLVLGLSLETEVDSWGETLLRSLQAQGMPGCVAVVPSRPEKESSEMASSSKTKSNSKTQQATLKSLLSFSQYFVPSLTRVFDFAISSDVSNAVRSVCEGKPADVRWRTGRSYLLAEEVRFDAVEEGQDGIKQGTLKVTGVVRGAPMSADRLVHIHNWGDYRLNRIIASPRRSKDAGDGSMDVEDKVLGERTDDADDLASTVEVDELAGEQTWPTEEEMRGVGTEGSVIEGSTNKKSKKRVPKGTSAYQAAWLLDDEEVESDDDSASSGSEEEGGVKKAEVGVYKMNLGSDLGDDKTDQGEQEEEEEYEDVAEEESSKAVAFEDMDMEEEKRQLETWRARQKEHASHIEFPDEVDTPMEIPARQRFARYRGLKSMKTSPWDPDENLPRDYAKIFKVGEREWDAVSRRLSGGMEEGVEPGTRVTVEIANVPQDAFESYDPKKPFTIFGLHQHEHKKTVLNFTIQRNSEFQGIIKAKDPLILLVGPRRLRINPILSQHLRGGSKTTNNVYKFERFLKEGVVSVGTIYAPLMFGRLPVTVLKETSDGQAPIVVGSGTLLPPSTTRIIAKRIVLTGHPLKVHKRTVTIRYMFFNPADVEYFKPVQLHTKHGRTGHIMESLGTHGYFKARFDAAGGGVGKMDTACMPLYKRVWPRWAEEWKQEASDRADEMEE